MWEYKGKTPAYGKLYINVKEDRCKVVYRYHTKEYYSRNLELTRCLEEYFPFVYNKVEDTVHEAVY